MFPEEYPFDYARLVSDSKFWFKYYISQRTFFMFRKDCQYQNLELLCNAFATKIINLEEAEIFEIKSNELKDAELAEFLRTQDIYSGWRFAQRAYQLHRLQHVEEEIKEALSRGQAS